MIEDKKLDLEALKGVTGGGLPTLVSDAWARILENESANDNKEEQP